MSTALQFWSALIVPMGLMLAAPRASWLFILAPVAAAAMVVGATFAPADVWTGFLLLIGITGLGCGLALRVMLAFVRGLMDGR
jgi:hypothetical protein